MRARRLVSLIPTQGSACSWISSSQPRSWLLSSRYSRPLRDASSHLTRSSGQASLPQRHIYGQITLEHSIQRRDEATACCSERHNFGSGALLVGSRPEKVLHRTLQFINNRSSLTASI